MEKVFKVLLIMYFIFADFALLFMNTKLTDKILNTAAYGNQLLGIYDALIVIVMTLLLVFIVSVPVRFIKNNLRIHIDITKEDIVSALKSFFNFKTRPVKTTLWIVQILIALYMIPFTYSGFIHVLSSF